MTTRNILKKAAEYLQFRGVLFAEREAEDLLLDFLGKSSRSALWSTVLSPQQQRLYWERVYLRGTRVPTAYIHGSVNFLGLSLKVGPEVLIPRQETEILAERIIQYLAYSPQVSVFYDVCCGSGCLGLAVKAHCPHVKVVLSDICPKAASLARKNAELNQLDVDVLEGDLFAPFDAPADAFVCNPPYLSLKEIFSVDPEVRCHEPWKALLGGISGLDFYYRIARDLKQILLPGGVGWLEIGATQGECVKEIFNKIGVSGELYQDYAGLDRIFFLEYQEYDPVSYDGYS